jgi:hypothetical protein
MTDAERLRIVLTLVRRARKILAQYSAQRTGGKGPKPSLVRKLKGVLESDDMDRAMTAAPIAKLKKSAEQAVPITSRSAKSLYGFVLTWLPYGD